jgi:hypothetical protein
MFIHEAERDSKTARDICRSFVEELIAAIVVMWVPKHR